MTTIPKLAVVFRGVPTTSAKAPSGTSELVQRRSKLTGAQFVQALVYGSLATPQAGMQELSRMAGGAGGREQPAGAGLAVHAVGGDPPAAGAGSGDAAAGDGRAGRDPDSGALCRGVCPG